MDTTAARAQTLKALLAGRRLPVPQPAAGCGVVRGRYVRNRDPAQPDFIRPAATGSPGPRFMDRGGLVLRDISLWLIYWGRAWSGVISPTASDITDAAQSIFAGTYFSGLGQYRGIRGGILKGSVQVTHNDPPNPFSNASVMAMIYQQLTAGALPAPDDDPTILYCVVLPPGVNSIDASLVGEHSYFTYYDLTGVNVPMDFDISRVHYAWVTNDRTLDGITTVLSHQLVESCTDPNGDAWQGVPGTCEQPAWCEIGDVCCWSDVRDGVRVQAYWSEVDRACIVPGEPAAVPISVPTMRSPRPRGRQLRARFAGGLLLIAWLVPIVATIVAVGAYAYPMLFPPWLKLLSDSPVLGGALVGVLFWLLLAAVFAPMADARHANGTNYADLSKRLTALDARLASVVPANHTSAYQEAMEHRNFIADELVTSGPRWIAAVGYVGLWQRIHRAEEALVTIEPRSQVVADALYDEWRLKDSALENFDELAADLDRARQYLLDLRVGDPSAKPVIRSESEARAVIAKVRFAIDDFRDKRRAALVRARNLLVVTMVITELFAAGLLALALIDKAPPSAVVAAVVFYLVGALVGLFNRLAQQVSAGTIVEDYSLAGVRLVLTPTISGLAAVGGVALTGMLAMSGLVGVLQPGSSPSSTTTATVPPLSTIFDLDRFRIGLVVAALFGGTPAILSRRLQQLTDQYQDDLKSTDPSSAVKAKAGPSKGGGPA